MTKKPFWEVRCDKGQNMTVDFALESYTDEDIEMLDRISMQTAMANYLNNENTDSQPKIYSIRNVLAGDVSYVYPSSVCVDIIGEVSVKLDAKKKAKVVDYLGSAMLLHDVLFSVIVREGGKLIKKYLIKHPTEGRTAILDFNNVKGSVLPIIILSAPH